MRSKLTFFFLLSSLSVLLAQPPGGGPGGPGGAAADGIWRRDAAWGEVYSLDACLGHQPPSGEYHYHANPVCLRATLDDNIELVRTKRVGSVSREDHWPEALADSWLGLRWLSGLLSLWLFHCQ